jgi:DNA-binding transcriptional LysR family regulator
MPIKKIPFEQGNWDDLRVFLEVARQESLSQAARRLGVDHSTVGRRIAQLEYSLDARLFERTARGLRITPLGERLLRSAQEMEAQILGFSRDRSSTSRPSAPTRIAMMEGIGSLYLARHADWLAHAFPGLHLELVTSPQVVHINKREADVFLSFYRPDFPGAHGELLCSFGLGLFASRHYLAVRGEPRNLADLERHDFVTYLDDLIQLDAVRWLDEVIAQPRKSFQSSSMIAQMAAAEAGRGIVLLPLFAISPHSDLSRVLPEVSVRRELWMSVDRDIGTLPRVALAMRALRELLRAHPL